MTRHPVTLEASYQAYIQDLAHDSVPLTRMGVSPTEQPKEAKPLEGSGPQDSLFYYLKKLFPQDVAFLELLQQDSRSPGICLCPSLRQKKRNPKPKPQFDWEYSRRFSRSLDKLTKAFSQSTPDTGSALPCTCHHGTQVLSTPAAQTSSPLRHGAWLCMALKVIGKCYLKGIPTNHCSCLLHKKREKCLFFIHSEMQGWGKERRG